MNPYSVVEISDINDNLYSLSRILNNTTVNEMNKVLNDLYSQFREINSCANKCNKLDSYHREFNMITNDTTDICRSIKNSILKSQNISN